MCKSLALWQTAPVPFSTPSKSHSADPPWRRVTQTLAVRVPVTTRHWLLDEGSLTERLIKRSNGQFRVERLRQSWQKPMPSERRLLGLGTSHWALIREVALYCHDQPWVYARSVIPARSLSGELRRLRRLQNESLGALIFQQPGLQRDPFEVALLPAASHYMHPSFRQNQPAWARRSRFTIKGKSLLVSEVFLERFQT